MLAQTVTETTFKDVVHNYVRQINNRLTHPWNIVAVAAPYLLVLRRLKHHNLTAVSSTSLPKVIWQEGRVAAL